MVKTNKLKIKRKLEIVVISDVHLGTFGCQAKALLNYLNSIDPKKIILNGDIIDIWQFKKHYFPKSHLKILKKLISLASEGVEIIYITGNHDELLRKFSKTKIGKLSIVDKYICNLDGKRVWFFHGDVFDLSIQNAKWIAKLGGWGYDFLILMNSLINWFLLNIGKEKYSLSKKIKNSVKGAVKFISNFENVVTELAIENNFDYVVCGHIHQPKIKTWNVNGVLTTYMNSGDWIENCTALEYQFKRWKMYNYDSDKIKGFSVDEDDSDVNINDLIAAVTVSNLKS